MLQQTLTLGPFPYEAATSAVKRPVPGSRVTVTASAGDSFLLASHGVVIERLTRVEPGEHMGTTLMVRAEGPGLDESTPVGTYAAQNIRGDEHSHPLDVRWLFVAPQSGEYTLELVVSTYANRAYLDKYEHIRFRIPPGAVFTCTPVAGSVVHGLAAVGAVPQAAAWALPDADDRVLIPGESVSLMEGRHEASTAGRIVIAQDLNLTTCQRDDAKFPGCSVPGIEPDQGTRLATTIWVRPDQGLPFWSPTVHTRISAERHHQTVTNTFDFPRDAMLGDSGFRFGVELRVVKGSPLVVHRARPYGLATGHGHVLEVF